ncbi:hypothetical protein [Desulfovirgula thermocuniculi]|uniref:hypothetical protein n=1 Tax=Desulfovirgula thermocuniculi TaxID=348842 RepID=UPI0004274A9B|nr:hypothetical protein [Desulfovirgula thermocuniculi]
MKKLDLLYDLLCDKMFSQRFYNEQLLLTVNPAARRLFAALRDEEAQHVLYLRTEILHLESAPFPPGRIIPALRARPQPGL